MQIAANASGSIATFQTNAGDSEIKGLETELTWIPSPNTLINLGYGLINAEYKYLKPGVVISKSDNFILTPKHVFNFGASYKLPVLKNNLTLRVDGHYKSKMDFEAQNSAYVVDQGHFAMNGRIQYQPNDKVNFIFGVNNLTNKLYLVGGDANTVIGYENGIYARPRNFYFTAGYLF